VAYIEFGGEIAVGQHRPQRLAGQAGGVDHDGRIIGIDGDRGGRGDVRGVFRKESVLRRIDRQKAVAGG